MHVFGRKKRLGPDTLKGLFHIAGEQHYRKILNRARAAHVKEPLRALDLRFLTPSHSLQIICRGRRDPEKLVVGKQKVRAFVVIEHNQDPVELGTLDSLLSREW